MDMLFVYILCRQSAVGWLVTVDSSHWFKLSCVGDTCIMLSFSEIDFISLKTA